MYIQVHARDGRDHDDARVPHARDHDDVHAPHARDHDDVHAPHDRDRGHGDDALPHAFLQSQLPL